MRRAGASLASTLRRFSRGVRCSTAARRRVGRCPVLIADEEGKMRTTVKTRFGLTVTGLAVLAVALAPRQATADCAMGAHCSTDYCEISCDSEADYIVFGTWTEGANVKTGVCWWDNSGWSKGMYAAISRCPPPLGVSGEESEG
jgi:hypothetical protein